MGIGGIFLLTNMVYAQSSSNYTLKVDVFAWEGWPMSSANYILSSVVGQPSISGLQSSPGYTDLTGYLSPRLKFIPVSFLSDLDGDKKTDFVVYRTNTGTWFVLPSGGGAPYEFSWRGDNSDKPVPRDYDGDGKTDIPVYRTNTSAWYIIPSSGSTPYGTGWGRDLSYKPVSGDYNGNGKTELAVYLISTGAWYVYPSGGGTLYGRDWGGDPSDKSTSGDYGGDGKADFGVY